MAKYVLLVVLFSFTVTLGVANSNRQNITTLTFYAEGLPERVVAGPGAGPGDGEWNTTQIGFGSVEVFDTRLTEKEDPTSKYLGQVRGVLFVDGVSGMRSLDLINLDFVNDQFNGSLSFMGTGVFESPYREFPVVGGSGHFLFAKGYARLVALGDYYTGNAHWTLHYKRAASLEDF